MRSAAGSDGIRRRHGMRVRVRVPRTRVTAAAGLLEMTGREVVLVRRWSHPGLEAQCWLVNPPLVMTLRAPAMSDTGRELVAGDRLQLRALPEAWMSDRALAWSSIEIEFLREHYGTWLTADIAQHLGRGLAAVRTKVLDLGLRCRTVWTPELDEMLTLMFPDTAATELERLLGATAAAIRLRASQLGVKKMPGFAAENSRQSTLARSAFTPEIAEVIELLYPDTLTATIADFVGMSMDRVHAYANSRGWKKTKAFVRETARARTGPDHPMRRFQFQKGIVPANKGRKGMPSHPNMVPTQFKKGQRPHTWKPIGTQVVNPDNYLVQKVSDTGYPRRDWVPVHRLVWTAAYGEIPPEHVLRFKAGMHTTKADEITLNRLECVTRAENMRRNSYHTTMPPEVRKLVQLRGVMNRMINRRQRELAKEQA